MAIDPRHLKPSELCRLLNSTPLGTVIDERQLYRQQQHRYCYQRGYGKPGFRNRKSVGQHRSDDVDVYMVGPDGEIVRTVASSIFGMRAATVPSTARYTAGRAASVV